MPIGGTAFMGMNQHPRITTNYLNQASRHGDPAPGVPVSTAQVSGSIVQPYGGQIGGATTITNPWADQFHDPDVGPLWGGVIQYVQFNPLDSQLAARGRIAYWLDEMNYIVTTAPGTTPPNKVAGVIINSTYPGNWDFIYISGQVIVNFSGTVAVGTGVVATNGQGASGATGGLTSIGIAMAAGSANSYSPVQLNIQAGRNY